MENLDIQNIEIKRSQIQGRKAQEKNGPANGGQEQPTLNRDLSSEIDKLLSEEDDELSDKQLQSELA